MRELYSRAYVTESPAHFAGQHDEIVAALRARDGRAARKAMEESHRERVGGGSLELWRTVIVYKTLSTERVDSAP